MVVRFALLACVALPLLASCNPPPPHAGQPTLQGQSMQQMLADIHEVRAFVYGGSSQDNAEKAANDLTAWSKRLTELFPPGQATTDYVDMSPARLAAAPAAMTRSAQQLLAAVRTGNRQAIGDQLGHTEREGCGACHLSGSP
jgi:hypothetical protein